MKKYEFVDVTEFQKKINYSIATVGVMGLTLGITRSVILCNTLAIAGGTIAYQLVKNKKFTENKLINDNLYKLVKNNKFYKIEDDKIIYKPEIQYDFTKEYTLIKIRLDGSNLRDKYLNLENNLEDLFVIPCVEKIQEKGYIIYKLDKTVTKRLEADNINMLLDTIIPINNKVNWNYRKYPHALITGATGKGKTYFLAYIIKMLEEVQANIKILDPKISDLSFLEKIYKDNVASSTEKICKMLKETVEEMNKRYIMFKFLPKYDFGKDYKDYKFKPIFIIFDEVAAFMASIDRKIAREINNYMSEIIMKGRQAGVFMVLTTQRPDADVIKTSIRDQLGLRIALGKMSKIGYSMVFGSEFNDLELNNNAIGDGFIYINGVLAKPVRFQTPYFDYNYNFVQDIENMHLKS